MPFHINHMRAIPTAHQVLYSLHESPFGLLCIASINDCICYIGFCATVNTAQNHLEARFKSAPLIHTAAAAHQQMANYIDTHWCTQTIQPNTATTLTLCFIGTPFQQYVWQALMHIPFGKTCTYSDIASHIKKPTAVRAVATAIARNPLSLVVPCHRVLPKQGGTGQYYWGSALKALILKQEQNES